MPSPYLWVDFVKPEDISDTVEPNSKIIIGRSIEKSDYYYSMTGTDEGDSKINEINGHGSQKGVAATVDVLYSPNNDFLPGDKVRIFSPGEIGTRTSIPIKNIF